MLLGLNIALMVLQIGAMALVGQGVLHVLAGGRRNTNFIYQLFQVLNKPWYKAARFIAPRQVADSQVPFVAFVVVVLLFVGLILLKVQHCMDLGLAVAVCK